MNDDYVWHGQSVKELKKKYKIKGELKIRYIDGEPIFDKNSCLGKTSVEYKQKYNYKNIKDLHNDINENLAKEPWMKGRMNNRTVDPVRDYIENERPDLIDDPKEEALFISLKRNRIAVRSIEAMLKKFKTSAGIADNVSPHTLRRTYGTTLYNKTGDIYMVADVLGHKDVNTTVKHYAAIDEKHRKSAADVNLYDE